MNVSSLFVENLRTSTIYSVNDIRTSQFTLNSLGSYVYDVLNSSTLQGYAKLNVNNVFTYPPQSNGLPSLTNHLTTKGYVDTLVQTGETNNHSWSGVNTFLNPVSLINGLITNSSTINISSPRQIGYTYESEWSNLISLNSTETILASIVFDTPGVWQIHTQFEYQGEGIITHLEAGYSGSVLYKEDATLALETNEVVQRFVPSVIINQTGTKMLPIVSSILVNTGTFQSRCKYFYVRIA